MSRPAPRWLQQDGVLVQVLRCEEGDHCYVVTPDRDINDVMLVEGVFRDSSDAARAASSSSQGAADVLAHFAREELLHLAQVAEKRAREGDRVRRTGKVGPGGKKHLGKVEEGYSVGLISEVHGIAMSRPAPVKRKVAVLTKTEVQRANQRIQQRGASRGERCSEDSLRPVTNEGDQTNPKDRPEAAFVGSSEEEVKGYPKATKVRSPPPGDTSPGDALGEGAAEKGLLAEVGRFLQLHRPVRHPDKQRGAARRSLVRVRRHPLPGRVREQLCPFVHLPCSFSGQIVQKLREEAGSHIVQDEHLVVDPRL